MGGFHSPRYLDELGYNPPEQTGLKKGKQVHTKSKCRSTWNIEL